MRLTRIAIVLAAAAAPLLAVTAAHAAPAATAFAAPAAQTCDPGDTCFWSQTGLSGTDSTVRNAGFGGQWFNLCTVVSECQPLSVEVNGHSCLWLYDRQANIGTHVNPNSDLLNTHDMYGWAFIQYGDSCTGSIPTPLP